MAKEREIRPYETATRAPARPEAEPEEVADSRDSQIFTPAPTPEGEEPRGIPMDFRNIDPTDRGMLNRASAPYGGLIDDQRTEWEKMGGKAGSVLGFADDFLIPDDLGGIIRGDSDQWVPDVPYLTDAYQNTVGGLLGSGMETAATVFEGLEWTRNQVAAGNAWALSALPGGPRTMDLEWDGGATDVGDGADISFGSMATSVYSSIVKSWEDLDPTLQSAIRGVAPVIASSPLNPLGLASMPAALGVLGADAASQGSGERPFFLSDEFDVYNEEDRKIAFEEESTGKYITGVTDAVTVIAYDPLTYASFPIKILGSGIQGSTKFPGMLNKSLSVKAAREQLDLDIDAGVASLARQQGTAPNAVWENVIELVDKTNKELTDAGVKNPFLKNMPRYNELLEIKGTWGTGDEAYVAAAATLKAMNGNNAGLYSLKAAGKFDTLRALGKFYNNGVDIFQTVGPLDNLPPALQFIGRGIVDNALVINQKNPALRGGLDNGSVLDSPLVSKMSEPKSFIADDFSILPKFTNQGPSSLRVTRAAIAARSGRSRTAAEATRKQKPNVAGVLDEGVDAAEEVVPVKPDSPSIVDEYNNGWLYRTITATSSSSPVKIVRWLGKGLPPGILHLKGGDSYKSVQQLNNWLRLSYIAPLRQSELLDEFINAGNPTSKASVVIKIEKEAVSLVAKRAGLKDESGNFSSEAALDLYESYNASRGVALQRIRNNYEAKTSGFAPDPDVDQLITNPGLFSEIDEAFPLLDIKEFRSVVNSNKSALQYFAKGRKTGLKVADFLNNGWKVAVLLRLGYTARNITEGALRSAAVMGTVALNPAIMARVPSSLKYAAYKKANKKQINAKIDAILDAQSQMREIGVFQQEQKVLDLEQEISVLQTELARHQGLAANLLADDLMAGPLVKEKTKALVSEVLDTVPDVSIPLDVSRVVVPKTKSQLLLEKSQSKLLEAEKKIITAREELASMTPKNPISSIEEFAEATQATDLGALSVWRNDIRFSHPELFKNFYESIFPTPEQALKNTPLNRTWWSDANATSPMGFELTMPPGLSAQGRKDFINDGTVTKTFVLKMIREIGAEETMAWLRYGNVDAMYDDVLGSGNTIFGSTAPLRVNPKTNKVYGDAKRALPEEFTADFETSDGLMEPSWTMGGAYGRQKAEVKDQLDAIADAEANFEQDFKSGLFDYKLESFAINNPVPEFTAALKKFNGSDKFKKADKKINDLDKEIRKYKRTSNNMRNGRIGDEQKSYRLSVLKARKEEYEKAVKKKNTKEVSASKKYQEYLKKVEEEIKIRKKVIEELRKENPKNIAKVQSDIDISTGRFIDETETLLRGRESADILTKDIERLRLTLDDALAKLKSKEPKRNRVGEGGNKVGVDSAGRTIIYDAAFDGSEGSMARLLSAADKTYNEVFKTGFDSDLRRLKALEDYEVINPSKISKDDKQSWAQYWNNLTDRLNKRYRQDEIINGWLKYGDEERDMLDVTRRKLLGDASKDFRDSFRRGPDEKPLSNAKTGKADPEAVEEFIQEMYRRYTSEIPKNTGIRQTLLKKEMGVLEVRAAMSNADELPRISALKEERIDLSQDKISAFLKRSTVKKADGSIATFKSGGKAVGWATGRAMKVLGSIPETSLLRHPFYAASYQKTQIRMVRLALQDGKDPTKMSIQKQINGVAHTEALKETRKIMYTIEEKTNAANLLRFLFPFFPAWENALKTWSGIVAKQPAVLVFANELWNIPNGLGWVVDENGDKVPFSNFLDGTENNKIMFPENFQKASEALHGIPVIGNVVTNAPIISAFMPPVDEDGNTMPTGTRQSSINVVTQGNMFNPGVGTIIPMTSKVLLQGKPELTQIVRNALPEEVFRIVVPNGDPNTRWRDIVAPTFLKKQLDYAFAGENENTAYLRLKTTMVQDAIVKGAIEGKVLSQKDFEKVIRNADAMWVWTNTQAIAGYTASTGYASSFAVERKMWRDLLDNTRLPYPQKIVKFIKKIEKMHPGSDGQDFLELTRSTTESKFKVNPNKQAYDRLTRDSEVIDKIARKFGPDMVGLYTNIGDWSQAFDPSVYSEMQQIEIEGSKVKQKKTGAEIRESSQVSNGWQEFFLVVDFFDEQAKAAGFDSYKEIEGHEEVLRKEKERLGVKYKEFGVALRLSYDVNKINRVILTAEEIVKNATEEDRKKIPAINTIEEFIDFRKFVVESLAQVEDIETRKKIRQMAAEEVSRIRNSGDPGFVDFYDKYFSEDEYGKAGQTL